MKKTLMTLLLGTAILFMSPNAQAQETAVRKQAKQMVEELMPVLELDNKQVETMYELFTTFNNYYGKEWSESSETKHKADKEKIEKAMNARLQVVLSDEQYEKYLEYMKKRNKK